MKGATSVLLGVKGLIMQGYHWNYPIINLATMIMYEIYYNACHVWEFYACMRNLKLHITIFRSGKETSHNVLQRKQNT